MCGYSLGHSDSRLHAVIRITAIVPSPFSYLQVNSTGFLSVNAVRLMFLLLWSVWAWRLLPEQWYGRWGGPSGRAHPYRLCQSISEQRQAFSHSAWKLHIHLSAEVHSNLWTTEGYFSVSCGSEDQHLIYYFFRFEAVRRDHRILLRTVA